MKKIVLCIVFVVILSSAFAFADNTTKIITVQETINKIMIDGEDKTPTDKKPFVYEGTTYVPLRFISEAFGKEITWDGKTRTIYLGKVPEKLIVENSYLTDMKIAYFSKIYLYRIDNSTSKLLNKDNDNSFDYPDNFAMSLKVDPITSKVEQYSKGISVKAYENMSSIIYHLDKKYNRLTGSGGFDNTLNKKIEENYIVKFIVDGKEKQVIELKKEGFEEHINVDLVGGKELEIRFVRPEGNKNEPFINLVDLVLEKHKYE